MLRIREQRGLRINLPIGDAISAVCHGEMGDTRRSSRTSSSAAPLGSWVAPALNMLLAGYGQSLIVRIGFPS
jgi:hypothetical protein